MRAQVEYNSGFLGFEFEIRNYKVDSYERFSEKSLGELNNIKHGHHLFLFQILALNA